MSKLTRRGFIKQASVGAGAMGVLVAGAANLEPVQASASSAKAAESDKSMIVAGEPLMVVVSNPASGNVTLLHGEHERTVSSPALVKKLLSL